MAKSDIIYDVKARIQFMEGSPSDEFAIVYGEKIKLKVHRWHAVEIVKAMVESLAEIFVRSPRGNILSFHAQYADTIKDLKLQIEEKEKIPFRKPKLIYEGKLLKDVNTLAECNIQKESNLQLHVYG
ncbi:hypothetical protein Syun_029900 [Stephania yunnanensis]|uniref:Ubiquitin-like domain-containing protein n=1 Tax=Stephania yunnanensis TaxID=152371 RepID=A0AAP0E6H6_9MAGN